MPKAVEKFWKVWYNKMLIDATNKDYRTLNEEIRKTTECQIIHSLGQRFIGAGMKTQRIKMKGIPGNALGAYLAGAEIEVDGNAQDAVGDTMNDGKIVVHGNIGDALGYAMRGGKILVRGNAGYRVGIHMKEYHDKKPQIIIGGKCGSFLGEYQAGGIIVVLGLSEDGKPIVGNFPCTGMHGGKMFLRGSVEEIRFPHTVTIRKATDNDLSEIIPLIDEFCELFHFEKTEILSEPFWLVAPDTKNPYKQMYVAN